MNFQKTLKARIQSQGPLPLGEVMELSNDYYYAHHHVFGKQGDFITSPEISPLFGEILAFWLMGQCERLHITDPVILEMGPGRGFLMQDMLRILTQAKITPHIHILEKSERLRSIQQESLADFSNLLTFHEDLKNLPNCPIFWIANEFFDALPVEQYQDNVRVCVDMETNEQGDFFVFTPYPVSGPCIKESSPVSLDIAIDIAKHMHTHGGAALIIDYGDYTEIDRLGNTLQAVKNHAYVDPLQYLGEADLTAHVDFYALSQVFLTNACQVSLMTQREFLLHFGLEMRLLKSMHKASFDQQVDIQSRAERLIDPTAMGHLFKVMEVFV
jgi:SAM-dependent MidA family methyltransferase